VKGGEVSTRGREAETPQSVTRQATQEQLVQFIRFSLDELRSTNGHHRFEDLCRQFARAVIVPNILPATGPVGAGGDRGRDLPSLDTVAQLDIFRRLVEWVEVLRTHSASRVLFVPPLAKQWSPLADSQFARRSAEGWSGRAISLESGADLRSAEPVG
jgi:hypothetical protein